MCVYIPRKLFLVSFFEEPVNDLRNLDALLRKFLMNGAVDMVYMIGFTAEFRGSTNTATQAYTCKIWAGSLEIRYMYSGVRPGPTTLGLYSHRRKQEA